MSEETKKESLTEEQLKTLETAVKAFIDRFKEIADKNKEEKEVEVEKENKDGTFTTKKEIQTKILGYNEGYFKSNFKFTKDDYKFSIEKFKKDLEIKNKDKQEANKQTLSDFVIKELFDSYNIFGLHFSGNNTVINYINSEKGSQAKQDIFNLFSTLITNLIDNNIIKDFFKDSSNTRIGRIFSIIATYSPNSNKFTELTNKLLPHIDEKDKQNVLLYGKMSGNTDVNKEQNATYYLSQNPNIDYSSVEQIIKNINTDSKIENLVSSKNVLNLLKKDYIIDNQNKSKELFNLFFNILLNQDLKDNKDEVKEYFSNSISSDGTYSNFLLDYASTYNKISDVGQKQNFKAQFHEIINKLKDEFGDDFVIDLLSIAKIQNDKDEKTEFDFLDTDLIQDETIRSKVIKKINQKKETIKTGEDGKITKFEKLNELAKDGSEEFKEQFLELGGYDEKMAYLYYVSNLTKLYNNIQHKYYDEDNKDKLQIYKQNIQTISTIDPEFAVNFISNIYKNTDSNKSLNDTSLVSGLITNTEIDIPKVLLNYNEKARKGEIQDTNCHKTKTLVSKYNIIENTSHGKQVYKQNENTSDTVIGTLKLINDLYGYEELKHAIIHNRTSTGSMEIFTIYNNPQECIYDTFEQIINLITESAKKAGKNPNEELVNEILPHFGGENWSFKYEIFKIAPTEDIIKYLNKVKEICNSYDTEKKQTEGTSLKNLLLNNYGANIFDLMNNRKENKLMQEHYKQIKEILGEKLYIELASRSKNEDTKNILTPEQQQNIEQQKNTRNDLIKKMVEMVQKQNVEEIKTELNKIENEDKRCELLYNVFKLSKKHIIEPKHNKLETETLYLSLEEFEDFNKKTEKKEKYCNTYTTVIDYENIIHITSNLIDDENYKELTGKICTTNFGYTSYNLIADALAVRTDIIKNKKTYYKNILNIISKLDKEVLIYILNQRNSNGNSENLLCSLVNTGANYEEQFGINYITSVINVIYEKIGHEEFQKIMGNKAVADNFNGKVKHSDAFNSKDGNKQDKANIAKSFISSIQKGEKPKNNTLEQMQQTTHTFIKDNMDEQFLENYKKQLPKPTEPQPQSSQPNPEQSKSEQAKPTEQANPEQSKPTEQSKSEQAKPTEQANPEQSKPTEQTKPIKNSNPKPTEQANSEQSKPTEQTKPIKNSNPKPTEQQKPTPQLNPQPSKQTTPPQTPIKQTTSTNLPPIQKTTTIQQSSTTKPSKNDPQSQKPKQSKPTEQSKPVQQSSINTTQSNKQTNNDNKKESTDNNKTTTQQTNTQPSKQENSISNNTNTKNNDFLKLMIPMMVMNYNIINMNRGRNINPMQLMIPLFMFNNNQTTEELILTIMLMNMTMSTTNVLPNHNKQQELNKLKRVDSDLSKKINNTVGMFSPSLAF